MKRWVEEYGENLLAVTAGCMILAIIVTSGILAAIGTRIDTKESCNKKYQDFQSFWKISQREKPKIVCNTKKYCYAGEVISIDEVFQGEDADGRKLIIEVKEILDHEGISCMDMYQPKNHQIIFPKAGTYQFKVRVQDEQKLSVTKFIEIPVDNRKERL